MFLVVIVAIMGLLLAGQVKAERVTALAPITGMRSDQTVLYGLVAGPEGIVDQTIQAPIAGQSLKAMQAPFLVVPVNANSKLKVQAASS